MRITHKLFEFMSGAPLSIPITATGSWNDSLTTVGSGRFSIPLEGSPFTPAQWRASTAHWFHMVAELWDDHPVFFGLIARKEIGLETNTLEVSTVTVNDLFANRFTFGVGTYPGGDLTVESQSYRAALVQVILRAINRGATWTLPFDFDAPTYEAGGFSQEWKNHDWKRISDLIDIIQSQDGGPDLAFIPKLDANGYARWDVRIGTPRISGPTIDLPMSVRKSRARGARIIEDGVNMLSGAFTRGEGMGKNRAFGEAGFIGGPTMAVRDAARDMPSNDANLNGIALADLKRNRGPITQYEFDLMLNGAAPFPLSDFRLGTRFNLRHSGNAYLEPASQMQYTVARSFATSTPDTARPEVQAL